MSVKELKRGEEEEGVSNNEATTAAVEQEQEGEGKVEVTYQFPYIIINKQGKAK